MTDPMTKNQAVDELVDAGVIDGGEEGEDITWWSAGERDDIPHITREGAMKIGEAVGADKIMLGGSRIEWLIASVQFSGVEVDDDPTDYFNQHRKSSTLTSLGWITLAKAACG